MSLCRCSRSRHRQTHRSAEWLIILAKGGLHLYRHSREDFLGILLLLPVVIPSRRGLLAMGERKREGGKGGRDDGRVVERRVI